MEKKESLSLILKHLVVQCQPNTNKDPPRASSTNTVCGLEDPQVLLGGFGEGLLLLVPHTPGSPHFGYVLPSSPFLLIVLLCHVVPLLATDVTRTIAEKDDSAA